MLPYFALSQFIGPIIFVLIVILLISARRKRAVTLVIKEWYASNVKDSQGHYVRITGRRSGVISWILSLIGVDPVTTVAVLDGRVEFEQTSISGKIRRMIPLSSISASIYGYSKPIAGAIVLFIIFSFLGTITAAITLTPNSSPDAQSLALGVVLGVVVAALYYFLNRLLTLGVIEHSGDLSGIQFKRSVIENQEINEEQANYVCVMIQTLIENDRIQSDD